MKFIALPSGKIINLEQVAFVDAPGIFGDQKPEGASLRIHFSAISFAVGKFGAGGGSLHCSIEGEDIKSFLATMGELGLKTEATLASITKKMN
jgi:hypothetical protein